MKTLGNILWHFPFFGFVSAGIVYLIGLLLTATVIAAPIGLGLMQLGRFLLTPFGHEMVSKKYMNAEVNPKWDKFSTIIMIIWLPIGIVLSILATFQAIGLAISIVGIPVALVVAKSIPTYFNPVNKICVSSLMAEEVERSKVQAELAEQNKE